MAQKVNIVLVDDIDGSPAEETVAFSIDGKHFEIDLNPKNAKALRDALAPYIGHARRSGGSRRRGRASAGVSASDIREWARSQGMDVSDRGRVSEELRSAYAAAH